VHLIGDEVMNSAAVTCCFRLIPSVTIVIHSPHPLLQVNTERYLSSSRGTQHTQGAWPKDVKVNDVQDRERFLRRIENLPQYQQSVSEGTVL